jgi:hypothetical protein
MDLKNLLNYTYKIGSGQSTEPLPVKVTIDFTDKVERSLKFTGVVIGSAFVVSALLRIASNKKG